MLSINGVIQQPNQGTNKPQDGFALDGATIKLAEVPTSTMALVEVFAVVIMGRRQ